MISRPRSDAPTDGPPSQPAWLIAEPAACYGGGMANPPRFGDEWPVSSWPAKVILGAVVFALGVLAGAGIAMWLTPPS